MLAKLAVFPMLSKLAVLELSMVLKLPMMHVGAMRIVRAMAEMVSTICSCSSCTPSYEWPNASMS